MTKNKQKYEALNLAVIVPTKDRPQKIRNLLNSLAAQTASCRRIIIVDGGKSVKNIVMEFSDRLPVEYYQVSPPGQIRQRNKAISLLDNRTSLAAFLDDDIVLEPEAVQSIVSFWNNCEPETAGVSFNIVNSPSFKHTWLKGVMGMSSPEQGKVLSSGYNVATSPVTASIRTQWLCGGATVWRKEILNTFINKEISSKWAICEDVNFSYPIGKKYPLYVCADAKVRHEHVLDHAAKQKYRYYGRTTTLWRLFFVESHHEFSRMSFLWMLVGQIISRCILGSFSFRTRHLEYIIGQIEGAVIGLKALHRGVSLSSLLNEEPERKHQ